MNYIIDPAGWWQHLGISFWAVTDSESINADQDPFYVIPAPGAHPGLLGYTLAPGSIVPTSAGCPRMSMPGKHGASGPQISLDACGPLANVFRLP